MRTLIALLPLIAIVALGDDPFSPGCDPSDAKGVGCIVSLQGSAKFDRNAAGEPQSIKAFDRAANRKAGIHLRSGDSFWLSPGSSAKIFYYYKHGTDALNPAEVSGPDSQQEKIWYRDASAQLYTDPEMNRLRRRLRLAAAPKAMQARDVILPASGDLVSGRGFTVVVRTNGLKVSSCTLSLFGPDGAVIGGQWKALASWQSEPDITQPFTLELDNAALSRLGSSTDAKLVVAFEDGSVMNRSFRLTSRSMGSEFRAQLRPLIKTGRSTPGAWEEYCDLFEEATRIDSVSAIVTASIEEAKQNNGIMKGRLVTQDPALLRSIEDLFLQAGFKEDEIWPLLAHPGSQ